MLTKKERMEKLNAMGANTSKYFSVDLDNGTKIHLIIDENGDCKQVAEKDVIMENIIADGYVKNSKLFRRFVMAQMFAALNYVSYDGRHKGYNDCIKRNYGYDYTFKMMLEEVRVLSKLETRDKETFLERAHFFDKRTITSVLNDYIAELKNYVAKLPTKNCKGVPYKRVKSVNIFVDDLNKKLYAPVEFCMRRIDYARSYNEIYYILRDFMRDMVKLPYDTRKSKAWIDAYKGEGAYYTMKNLLAFHGCVVETGDGIKLYGVNAVKYIEGKLDDYKGEGWRMFALMKKVIKDNGINTKTHIAEVCNK